MKNHIHLLNTNIKNLKELKYSCIDSKMGVGQNPSTPVNINNAF